MKENRLFVAYKPPFVSSTHFLNRLKRKYNKSKAGFSGTLDPFAKGCLIVAFGNYTRLFSILKKNKKRYIATLWLGAVSSSLDIENILNIESVEPLSEDGIKCALNSLIGEVTYLPPKYSAKWIDGERAYKLTRNNVDFELENVTTTVYDVKLINYNHPFITFDITISEGGYVRSLAQLLCERVGVVGTLSSLERVSEGEFFYDNEKPLNPVDFIDYPKNRYFGDIEDIANAKKNIDLQLFEKQDEGIYLFDFDKFFSIIEITNERVKYLMNRIERC
ncbi:MAG: tRNA pseudouridine(55) synthase TruB [Campylobacterales bacterium]|nr:tRNA pseudouridine(55) synthase TruB [Campylobacterales bacterium]